MRHGELPQAGVENGMSKAYPVLMAAGGYQLVERLLSCHQG